MDELDRENLRRSNLGAKRVRLRDLAEELQVSVTTVSRSLRGDSGIGEDTRRRIRSLAAARGYVHNTAGAALSTGRTFNVIFVVPYDVQQFPHLFHLEVFEGLAEILSEQGYTSNIVLERTLRRRGQDAMDAFRSAHADGGVLVLMHHDELVGLRPPLPLPIVLVNHDAPSSGADCVIADDRHGGYSATRYLLDMGHRRIAHVSGPLDVFTIAARLEGYRRALDECGLAADETLVVHEELSSEGGHRAMQELLRRKADFTAVFCCMDLVAVGALAALREAGLRVPEDVSAVGFDDDAIARVMWPALTTVQKPRFRMGSRAGEILYERMLGRGTSRRVRSLLKTKLIVRDSVRPCGR